ncbi:MAG: hypothetical protein LQ351_000732 [Letrouitia transgressa]|nr:MAG: hypothetical protein LQ351_000732 [Letrouitia transgressa]
MLASTILVLAAGFTGLAFAAPGDPLKERHAQETATPVCSVHVSTELAATSGWKTYISSAVYAGTTSIKPVPLGPLATPSNAEESSIASQYLASGNFETSFTLGRTTTHGVPNVPTPVATLNTFGLVTSGLPSNVTGVVIPLHRSSSTSTHTSQSTTSTTASATASTATTAAATTAVATTAAATSSPPSSSAVGFFPLYNNPIAAFILISAMATAYAVAM